MAGLACLVGNPVLAVWTVDFAVFLVRIKGIIGFAGATGKLGQTVTLEAVLVAVEAVIIILKYLVDRVVLPDYQFVVCVRDGLNKGRHSEVILKLINIGNV